jgi:hypothetical protein
MVANTTLRSESPCVREQRQCKRNLSEIDGSSSAATSLSQHVSLPPLDNPLKSSWAPFGKDLTQLSDAFRAFADRSFDLQIDAICALQAAMEGYEVMTIEDWRRAYNHVRPHPSLGNLTPAAYARRTSTTNHEPAVF